MTTTNTDTTTTDDCLCTDEYGPCEDHCTLLASREGASHRTADELCVVFLEDAFGILDQPYTPVIEDLLARVEADRETQAAEGPVYCHWISDPDLADELRDAVWQVESTLGAWTLWDDGYRIVEPTEDCPLIEEES